MSTEGRTRAVHPNLLLAIFATAAFMTALDVFIVNVALRELGHDIGQSSLSNLSWVLNAYAIVFAALLVPAGRFGDRFGNKQTFIAGLAVFSLASLGCALSGNLWLIVVLRCVQAIGAAALVPTSLGLVLTTIPPERRLQSVRVWAVTGSIGAVAGPTLGGLLVALSWRWIFVINVPIGMIALIGAVILVPDVRHNTETRIPDLLGGGLLIVAASALSLAMVQGPEWGWASASSLVSFAVAIGSAGVFVARCARHPAPIIDLHLFRDRVFARACGALAFGNLAYGLLLLAVALWMQEGWGWSPLKTGLAIGPGPAMVSIVALGLRRYTVRFPDGVVAAVGMLMIAGGGLLIGLSVSPEPNYLADMLPGWLIAGIGTGLAMPTVISVGTATLPRDQTSTGSAVLQMGRWIGTTLGVAILVIVIGSSTGSGASASRYSDAYWWATIPALIAAVMVFGMTPRRAAPVPSLSPREQAQASAMH